jgi:hypothetical protein
MQESAQLFEAGDGFWPESHGVDRNDLVEWSTEVGERIGSGESQVDPARADGSGITPPRDAHHDIGMVDAKDHSVPSPIGQRGDGDAGTDTDFQDPVRWLHVE